MIEWPPEKKAIDIGDFYADSSLIAANARLAADARPLRDGLRRTVAFYRAHMSPLRAGRVAGRRVVNARLRTAFH